MTRQGIKVYLWYQKAKDLRFCFSFCHEAEEASSHRHKLLEAAGTNQLWGEQACQSN
jgi:hypothetical protein